MGGSERQKRRARDKLDNTKTSSSNHEVATALQVRFDSFPYVRFKLELQSDGKISDCDTALQVRFDSFSYVRFKLELQSGGNLSDADIDELFLNALGMSSG